MGKEKVEEDKSLHEETVSLSNLGVWIKKKEKEDINKEKEILILIKDRISLLIKELDEKLINLEKVDLQSKKVENKIKVIVSGNLKSYIHYVKLLVKNLGNIEEKELGRFIDKVNKTFFDFQKNSNVNYQKATFLVGNEMSDIKKTLHNFSKDFTKTLEKNKKIIDSSKQIFLIQSKLTQFDEINDVIEGFNKKKGLVNVKIKNIGNEIKKIETSADYIENLKKQDEIELNAGKITKEIYQLKSMINFKVLSNAFHSSIRMMGKVKKYKEKFESTFQDDDGVGLLELLDEAKLNTELINSKIKLINVLKNKLAKDNLIIKETSGLSSKVKDLKQEVNNLKAEIVEEEKRYEKIKINKESVINQLKEELVKIDVKLKIK